MRPQAGETEGEWYSEDPERFHGCDSPVIIRRCNLRQTYWFSDSSSFYAPSCEMFPEPGIAPIFLCILISDNTSVGWGNLMELHPYLKSFRQFDNYGERDEFLIDYPIPAGELWKHYTCRQH